MENNLNKVQKKIQLGSSLTKDYDRQPRRSYFLFKNWEIMLKNMSENY